MTKQIKNGNIKQKKVKVTIQMEITEEMLVKAKGIKEVGKALKRVERLAKRAEKAIEKFWEAYKGIKELKIGVEIEVIKKDEEKEKAEIAKKIKGE